MEETKMRVAAFDMGTKNFAFAVVDIDPNAPEVWGNPLSMGSQDLRQGCPFQNMITYLGTYDGLWATVDVVLIEQQLYRKNIKAARLACHTHAYFLHRHPGKPVYEYPAYYKTKYTGFHHAKSSHRERKEYAIRLVLGHYEETDPVFCEWLSGLPKKDDVCDCVLMCNTFPVSPLYAVITDQRR